MLLDHDIVKYIIVYRSYDLYHTDKKPTDYSNQVLGSSPVTIMDVGGTKKKKFLSWLCLDVCTCTMTRTLDTYSVRVEEQG